MKRKIIVIFIALVVGSIGLFNYHVFASSKEETEEPIVKKKDEEKTTSKEIKPNKIKIDIKGAVNNPGVYELQEGTIINEALDKAGGITDKGTVKNINLSKKITDEMAIIIYTKEELKDLNQPLISEECPSNSYDINDCYNKKQSIAKPTNDSVNRSTNNNSSSSAISGKISLNTANKEQLMTLSGIGEAKADKIIEYRETNGLFKDIEELKNISGIGEAIFAKIKDNLTL